MKTEMKSTMKELNLNEMENVNGGEVISTGLIVLMGFLIGGTVGCGIYENVK